MGAHRNRLILAASAGALGAAVAFTLPAAARAQSVEAFYAGRTISVLVCRRRSAA
jgi:uncharacterized membrane protein